METLPFTEQASAPGAKLADLLLAAAGEFRPVNRSRVDRRLGGLAARLPDTLAHSGDPGAQAEAILRLFWVDELRVSRQVSPDDALLDSVLERGEGHPLLLACVCAEVGRRAGIDAAPVRAEGVTFVGIRAGERAVLFDPAGESAGPAAHPNWMCPHAVAFEALSELSRLLAMHGRLREAIHAAELRLALPVAAQLRQRIDFEARALCAQLN
jgi:Transglutaminase-like superfamily